MINEVGNKFETNVLELMSNSQYEHLNFFYDEETQLKAIVSIHDTRLGPALGGSRFYPYAQESDALKDVLRLSRSMTFKAAVAGLDLGGGKSVILGNPKELKTPELMRAFGRCVERLNGKYITSVDSGTSAKDMDEVLKETSHVTGHTSGSGDPSPMTAIGVFEGIRASVNFHFGSPSLEGKKVAIQGLGNVGYSLAELLKDAGAQLFVTDISEERLSLAESELGATVVDLDKILSVPCDVLAPCALGGAIDPDSMANLNTPIIAGAANNQLSKPEIADELRKKNILYAPDFVINAGGLINVAQERKGYDRKAAEDKTRNIFNIISTIFERSATENKSTLDVAMDICHERLDRAGTKSP